MTEKAQIVRRTGTVGGLTFVSRIFGLVRDVIIAYVFGAHMAADAFFVAFRIPNLLRRFFAEGALTISFVPVFSDYLRRDPKEAKKVVELCFSLLAVILLVVVVVGIIAAPWIVKAIAYGFAEAPDKYALTVSMTRMMFPYIFFVSLAALGMGVLNSLKHFAAPAAAPILFNLGLIVGALFLTGILEPPVNGLAIGVLLGGLMQLAIHLPFMKSLHVMPRWNWQPRHPAIKRILPLMLASAYGAAVYQINVLVITFLASFLEEGSVSWLWYADRVMEFPLGIFGISMATVLLPTLSDHASTGAREKMREALDYGLRMTFFLTIPAMAGLIVLSQPIVRILFERGHFLAYATEQTGEALIFFALGLPAIAAVRIMTNAFFAIKDSKTPVVMATLSIVVNIILSVVLMKTMKHNGLALAISIAALCNLSFQMIAYRYKVASLQLKAMIIPLIKMTAAGFFMSSLVYWLAYETPFHWHDWSWLAQLFYLLFLIVVGVAVYLFALHLLKSSELRECKALIKH
jgi:putative peptidoglycan lipid II flippase